jgi:hypothetical protein
MPLIDTSEWSFERGATKDIRRSKKSVSREVIAKMTRHALSRRTAIDTQRRLVRMTAATKTMELVFK